VVDDETAIGKAKQTLRDSVAAIRKDTAERFVATSAAPGGTWPSGEYNQYPMAAGNRGSFQALAEQHQAAPQAHFDDLYRNLLSSGGRRGFNNNTNLFASGGGDSSVSHNLHGDRVVMPHPLRSNLFPQPIDSRQVRPMVQQSVEESRRSGDNALLQQLRTMGSRISDTTSRTEAARGAAAESTTAPLSPLDVTLLECLHRLHQDFILRRHFLLSQLSSDTRQQFLASEVLSTESSSRISASDRDEERSSLLGHVPFGRSLRVGDYLSATPSETQLPQEALARQVAAHAVEQGNQRKMPAAAAAPRERTVTALGRQKKAESSSSSSSDEDSAPRRGDINNKKPKRRRSYQGDDNDDKR
jgi:hypothetical protein